MFSKLLNDAVSLPLNETSLHLDQIDQSSIIIQLFIVVCILVLIVTILTCVLKISITSPRGYQDLSVEMEESRPEDQPRIRPSSEDVPQTPPPSPPPEEPHPPNEFMDMAASLLGPFVSMEYLRSVLERITAWFYHKRWDEDSGISEIRLANTKSFNEQFSVTTSRPRHRHRHNKKQPEFIVLDNGFNIDSVHEDDNFINFVFKQRIGSGFGGPFWPARFLRNPAAVQMVQDVARMKSGQAIV